jgi:hypothetical protein
MLSELHRYEPGERIGPRNHVENGVTEPLLYIGIDRVDCVASTTSSTTDGCMRPSLPPRQRWITALCSEKDSALSADQTEVQKRLRRLVRGGCVVHLYSPYTAGPKARRSRSPSAYDEEQRTLRAARSTGRAWSTTAIQLTEGMFT